MPTTYAHYKLGEKVTEALETSAKATILTNRELFDIGVHGPDIFFYHNPIIKSGIVKMGIDMHHAPGEVFFKRAAAVVRKNPSKEAHKAYLYGFLCHFALDVTCHGYIDEYIKRSGVGHYEIEAELDRRLLIKDGYNPVSRRLTGHLHATRENAAVISDFWNEVNAKQVCQTIGRMIICLNVLCAPSKLKRGVLFALMKLAGLYEPMHGLVINYTENPDCAESTEWLIEHFDKAAELAIQLITEYEVYLQNGGSLSETFSYDFESVKNGQVRIG